MNNKGQERPKCFSIPYDFGSPSSRPRPRACPSMTHAQARGGDGVSHLPRDGAERGAYRTVSVRMPLVAKGSESGRSPVCVHVFGVTMSNPRNTRDAAYSTPANECSRGRGARYARRTPARRPRGVCIDYMISIYRSIYTDPKRRRPHSTGASTACDYRGCFSTRHTPFRRRSVCSSCSPRVGHGGHGQVVACSGAPYAVWGPVNCASCRDDK